MCKYGDVNSVLVTIPADLSYTKKERIDYRKIDMCISDIVQALEKGGIKMRSSCCGHGKCDGEIILNDGRILKIKIINTT